MKILVMIDMQNDFLTGVLGNEQTAAVVKRVYEKAKAYLTKSSAPLFCTMDTHNESYMTTQEGRNLPVEHCIKGTDGWQLESSIRELTDSCPESVYKLEKGAFGAENLADCIKEICGENVSEIELIGVCTDICVISNAILLKTFFPEALITVDSSCCAGVTPESHENALAAMKMCQINVV